MPHKVGRRGGFGMEVTHEVAEIQKKNKFNSSNITEITKFLQNVYQCLSGTPVRGSYILFFICSISISQIIFT